MSSPREPLQATPLEPAAKPGTDTFDTPGTPRWVLPALGVLLLLAVLVIFWLPGQIEPANPRLPEPAAVQQDQPAPAAKAGGGERDSAGADAGTPWSDAQAAKLRQEAKDALEKLLEAQYELEERGVTQWAAEDYNNALATAKTGDEQYRQQQYTEARGSYEQALAAMQAISAGIPAIMDQQLAAISAAVDDGDVDSAQQTLAVAEKLEPENAALPELQQRVANLPGVLAQLDSAAQAEAGGDLASAERALQQAVALDPQHQRAAAELARVSAAYGEQQFGDAMSAGYRALDSGDYAAARKQFNNAAKQRPQSAEARSALAELAVAEQAGRLTSLQRQGERQAAAEDWDAAVKTYEQALAVDDNVVFARDGLPRARERAALDQSLRSIIEQPGRLSDIAVAESTAQLLASARAVSGAGPKLQGQIDTVDSLLQSANAVIPVTLTSDGQTEVIIYKVARLGTFQQRTLDLRPGDYRVRGSRVGFRDVLYTLEVGHDAPPPTLAVICTEKIL
ncbi:hypothetical protein [Haliea sp. E17]|uniref:hypothetical protein n=1 Tax=Haliea sp. E17 TaxID=3401576 RepID=UPI003AAEEFD7